MPQNCSGAVDLLGPADLISYPTASVRRCCWDSLLVGMMVAMSWPAGRSRVEGVMGNRAFHQLVGESAGWLEEGVWEAYIC